MQRGLLVVLVIAAAVAIWWFGLREEAGPAPEPPPLSESDSADGPDGPPVTAEPDEGPELEAVGARKPAEPEVEETPPPPLDGVTVTGRVLDGRRRPVPGADVFVRADYLNEPGPLRGTTDAAGRYRISGLARPTEWGVVIVQATHADSAGQAGASVLKDMADVLEVPALTLGPAHAIEVQARLEDGTPAAGARILLEVAHIWTVAVIADVRADDGGVHRFTGLPEASFRVLAMVEGRGRASAAVVLPARHPKPIVLTLGRERELTALVVDKGTGKPIPGARIVVEQMIQIPMSRLLPWVPAMPDLLTDAEGQARIHGLGLEDAVQINAVAEGYPGRGNMRMHRSIPQDDTTVRVELAKARQVRWPLAADNPHAPPAGTDLEFVQARGAMIANLPTSARIEEGHIVAQGCNAGLFHVVAVAPDGAFAQIMALQDNDIGREVTFAKPRKVVVILKHADGSPAEGYYVYLRNQGNNVIVDPTRVDETGRLELEVRYRHLLDVFASPLSAPYTGTSIGSLNLKEDGGTVEATLAATRKVELTVLIDGEARLPGKFTLGQGGIEAEEDPAKGILRFEVPAGGAGPLKLFFRATGYLPQTLEIPATEGDAVVRLQVKLAAGGRVLLKIKPPADGQHNVQVNKAGQGVRGYFVPPSPGSRQELGMQDGWQQRRLGPLEPGEYEATDSMSHARSARFTVEQGKETVIELDLSKVATVSGRVQLPEGYAVREARVQIRQEGVKPGPMMRYSGTGVAQDGTFRIRVPGNRAVTLEAWHPQLIRPDPGGSAQVTEAGGEVVLVLVAGGTASFKLDPTPPAPRHRGQANVTVFLYDGEPTGPPTRAVQANREDDVFTIGGFKPGTYTVVVSVRKRAPSIVGKLKLGAATDLGTVATTEGATVRFKLKIKEGQDPPRILARATAKTGIEYTRYINSRGEAEVLLKGLGAGTFEIWASPMSGFGTPGAARPGTISKTVESDGRSEIVIDVDPR